MNLLHIITSLIVWTGFYAAAENDPRNDNYVRNKRHGLLAGNYQPSYYYPNTNYYQPQQPNYYQPQYHSPSRSSYNYYPSQYQAQPSKYYYAPTPVVPQTPLGALKSIISRQDGPLNPNGYRNPNYDANRPRKKKKKLFVANVWG